VADLEKSIAESPVPRVDKPAVAKQAAVLPKRFEEPGRSIKQHSERSDAADQREERAEGEQPAKQGEKESERFCPKTTCGAS
jgi:hypothetical protein